MAATVAKVMILGDVQEHLETRAALLRHFWTITTVALDAGAVPKFEADLVVVASSLPEAERQEWVERVRRDVPKMLVVKINGYDSGPHAGADATVDETHGPGALVSTIYGLLTERGLGSRPWDADGAGVWLQ